MKILVAVLVLMATGANGAGPKSLSGILTLEKHSNDSPVIDVAVLELSTPVTLKNSRPGIKVPPQRRIQLMISAATKSNCFAFKKQGKSNLKILKGLVGKKVSVKGDLYGATSGFHFLPIHMPVEELKIEDCKINEVKDTPKNAEK